MLSVFSAPAARQLSYGHMIFLGLGLGTRDFGDLLGASLRGEHGNQAAEIDPQKRPQHQQYKELMLGEGLLRVLR